MSTITEIQEAIAKLSEEERAALRQRLDAYEEEDWDRQITADCASGKLDWMEEEAEGDPLEGNFLPLPGKIEEKPYFLDLFQGLAPGSSTTCP